MAKEAIDIDQTLVPGDRIELHFRSTGITLVKATQIAILESKLEKRPDFEVISIQTPTDLPKELIFVVEIKGPSKERPQLQKAGLSASTIALIIAGLAAGVLLYLTLTSVYKLTSSSAGKLAVAGTGVGIAAAGLALLLLMILPKR